ncbi:type IV secretory system conjugative DNA transfer family protein [Bacillus thuringiensis]|nr:type IV secretory system conjugative DNA transfer family protein [Bacillus thuringiensis]
MGRPGVGKSTAVKKILRGEYGRGTKIIIIDPEGGATRS